jgi:hypothetical protein
MSANFSDEKFLRKHLEPVTGQQIGRLDATFKVPSSNDHEVSLTENRPMTSQNDASDLQI